MCKKLEQVKANDKSVFSGAGDLVYSRRYRTIRGSIKNTSQFYSADQSRYREMLAKMRVRWHNYISVLESEVIETKLEFILDSFTFKYTRQPEMLSLVPQRVPELSLRVTPIVKIFNEQATEQEQNIEDITPG